MELIFFVLYSGLAAYLVLYLDDAVTQAAVILPAAFIGVLIFSLLSYLIDPSGSQSPVVEAPAHNVEPENELEGESELEPVVSPTNEETTEVPRETDVKDIVTASESTKPQEAEQANIAEDADQPMSQDNIGSDEKVLYLIILFCIALLLTSLGICVTFMVYTPLVAAIPVLIISFLPPVISFVSEVGIVWYSLCAMGGYIGTFGVIILFRAIDAHRANQLLIDLLRESRSSESQAHEQSEHLEQRPLELQIPNSKISTKSLDDQHLVTQAEKQPGHRKITLD